MIEAVVKYGIVIDGTLYLEIDDISSVLPTNISFIQYVVKKNDSKVTIKKSVSKPGVVKNDFSVSWGEHRWEETEVNKNDITFTLEDKSIAHTLKSYDLKYL